MTFSSWALVLASSALLSQGVACGGSSSETPWPAEPLDLDPGPAGEDRVRGNVVDTKKLPDNYKKRREELEKAKDQPTPGATAEPEPLVVPDDSPAPEGTPEPEPTPLEEPAPEPTPPAEPAPPAEPEPSEDPGG